MLGIIEISGSWYCNPIWVALQKNDSVRLCLDTMRLNQYIEADNEGPPPAKSILQRRHGIRVFTTM